MRGYRAAAAAVALIDSTVVVSRCLDVGDERQRSIIAGTMQGRISTLACDTYGSHVVQKAIDLIEGFDNIVIAE